MAERTPRPRIAIACQGGGSHTAFTAGVLRRLLKEDGHEVVALSGTSGGAICALLTWYGLRQDDRDLARDLLERFWDATAAAAPWDAVLNQSVVATSRLEGLVAIPSVSPYHYPPWPQHRLRRDLERLVPALDDGRGDAGPLLLVGAVDVLSGRFRVFSSAEREITVDAVLASAAVPNLFRAVRIGDGAYWDGLFSQNPPVRDLPDAGPDEIWVIRINPFSRASEPTSMPDIVDRRNELSGNLSLAQELFFIEKINELVRTGALAGTKYREIKVRTIALDRDLDLASKLDRRPHFLADLMDHGEEQATAFLGGRPAR